MIKNVSGYIHSVETAGTLDGPGVRRVLFLQGCPLACLYCHNPDGRPFRCGTKTDSYSELREIAKNQKYLSRAGGGVTLSGGEPLNQPEFVKSIFQGCKELGLHTALDTSGFTGHMADDELLSLTDLVLLDIKHINPEGYKGLTGVSLQPTLDFAKRLAEKNIPVWLRHVLVPGYTDSLEDLAELADFIRDMKNIQRVEILPLHKLGEWKWKKMGLDYKLSEIEEPSEELVAVACETLAKSGHHVYNG